MVFKSFGGVHADTRIDFRRNVSQYFGFAAPEIHDGAGGINLELIKVSPCIKALVLSE